MFGKTTKDIAATLQAMHDQARVECRHNQGAIVTKMAEWIALDRRFDSIPNKTKLAREAIDARMHGRQLNLTEPQLSGANSYLGHVVRQV